MISIELLLLIITVIVTILMGLYSVIVNQPKITCSLRISQAYNYWTYPGLFIQFILETECKAKNVNAMILIYQKKENKKRYKKRINNIDNVMPIENDFIEAFNETYNLENKKNYFSENIKKSVENKALFVDVILEYEPKTAITIKKGKNKNQFQIKPTFKPIIKNDFSKWFIERWDIKKN